MHMKKLSVTAGSDLAEEGWGATSEADREFLDLLAAEQDNRLFSDGRDLYERVCLLLAMGRNYRRLYRELSPQEPLSRHAGHTSVVFSRVWRTSRPRIMELRKKNTRDMMGFLDENAPIVHDVLERALLGGDGAPSKLQVDVAFKLFHQRYGRPTQRIAHEHSGGITHEHLRDSEQSLVAAFAALASPEPVEIIDTEVVAVEPGEPVVGEDERTGHAAVRPEPGSVAGNT